MRFGPYTNYDATLITNAQIIVRAVGNPAIDAYGNVTAAIGLPTRITLGSDGLFTNQLQQQNYLVTNSLGTPAFFNKGYFFRAPLDSGPTIHSTTEPGVFIGGMDYFVTLVGGSNGGTVTFNNVTNALGFTPIAAASTNGFVDLRITNNAATITFAESLTNGFVDKSITNNSATIAFAISLTNGIVASGVTPATATNIAAIQAQAVTNGFVDKRITNSSATISFAESLTNGFVDKSITNNAATQAYAQSLTNGFVDKSITNNAATQAYAQNLTNGFVDKSITNNAATKTYAQGLTNGFVDKNITNNAATVAQLNIKMSTNSGTSFSQTLINPVSANFSNIHTLSASYPNFFDDNSGLMEFTNVNGSYMSVDMVSDPDTLEGELDFVGGGMITLFSIDMLLQAQGLNTTNINFTTVGSKFLDRFGNVIFDGNRLANFTTVNNTGIYYGNLLGATNLPPGGISTNGSTANQILASVGGKTVFTNAAQILGTAYTNGFVDKSVTNNAATISLLNSASNTLQGQITAGGINAATSTNISSFLIGLSNAPIIATNLQLALTKLDKTNGTSYGQTATNFATEGNVSFGFTGEATNIISGTNVIKFINAGSPQVTNGAFIWVNSLACYTNWITGAIVTNNGSASLAQTNGVTLYSLSGTSFIGSYSAINGALPAPRCVPSFSWDHNGMIDVGYLSSTNINYQITNAIAIATNALNVIITNGSASGSIAVLGGFGTNTTLGNPRLNFTRGIFGNSNSVASDYSATLSGSSNSVALFSLGFSTVVGGILNSIGEPYSFIGGGESNSLSGSGFDFVGGGRGNTIGINATYSEIVGGDNNRIADQFSNGIQYSAILGGQYNRITELLSGLSGNYSAVLGGQSNNVFGPFSTAGGRNATITNYANFLWSDGTLVSTTTNSQVTFAATNGAVFLVGGIQLTNFNTNVAVQALGVTTNGWLTTNGVPGGGGGGGSGTVTSIAATVPPGFSISGSPVTTSGTLAIARSGGNDNYLGGGATNIGLLKATNAVFAGVITNSTLTPNAAVISGANSQLISVANPAVPSVLTNYNGVQGYAVLLDSSALKASQFVITDSGTNLQSTLSATSVGLTNTVSYTHEGAGTNFPIVFNGTLQTFTVTNGPDVFFSYAGANGSASFLIRTNVTLHFSYQPGTWLAGSNNVITNGVVDISSYGGTNANQLVGAIGEKQ